MLWEGQVFGARSEAAGVVLGTPVLTPSTRKVQPHLIAKTQELTPK